MSAVHREVERLRCPKITAEIAEIAENAENTINQASSAISAPSAVKLSLSIAAHGTKSTWKKVI
jgi:hypothetical protein